jgi:hypothetical protein
MLPAIIILATIALVDPPGHKDPPTKEVLAGITERGRSLAAYDAACWHASDAVQAQHPKEGSFVRYIAHKTTKGWSVAFGRLDDKGDRFLVAYEANPGPKPDEFPVRAFEPPREDTGFLRSAARAIEVVLQDFVKHFRGERRPYNVAVIPAEKGQLWVYLVPAPTKPGVWPLGGDVRYLMSPEGIKIVEKRQLHNSIIENEPPPEGDPQRPVMGMHTHVLDDIPEDTDVFHVLTRKPAVPEMIATERFVYQVGVDGVITYVGTTEEVLKAK